MDKFNLLLIYFLYVIQYNFWIIHSFYSVYLLLIFPSLISCSIWGLWLASIWHVAGVLRGSADGRHASVAQVACVAMVLLLIAMAHIIVLILVVSCVLSWESSLNSLVHRCTLQSLLWHRVVSAKPWSCWVLADLMLRDVAAAHHIPATCSLLSDMLVLMGMAIVEARTWSTVRIACAVSRCTGKNIHVVGLAIFLNLGKYTKSTLRWNETRNNFLSHILRWSSQQIL